MNGSSYNYHVRRPNLVYSRFNLLKSFNYSPVAQLLME